LTAGDWGVVTADSCLLVLLLLRRRWLLLLLLLLWFGDDIPLGCQ
jgi:hypothetical protein